jgi:hypothetical protein
MDVTDSILQLNTPDGRMEAIMQFFRERKGQNTFSLFFCALVGLTRLGKLRWWQELGIEI